MSIPRGIVQCFNCVAKKKSKNLGSPKRNYSVCKFYITPLLCHRSLVPYGKDLMRETETETDRQRQRQRDQTDGLNMSCGDDKLRVQSRPISTSSSPIPLDLEANYETPLCVISMKRRNAGWTFQVQVSQR